MDDDVRFVEPLRVVTLRHLPGAAARVDAAVTGLSAPGLTRPEPGRFSGRPDDGACLLWLSPNETLCIATSDAVPDTLLRTLAPGVEPLACALEVSHAWFAVELQDAAAVLPQLVDANAIPIRSCCGTRTRLADVGVLLLQLDGARTWLFADRAHRAHVLAWLAHARAAGA